MAVTMRCRMNAPLLRLAEACRGCAVDATHVFVRCPALAGTNRLQRLSKLHLLGSSRAGHDEGAAAAVDIPSAGNLCGVAAQGTVIADRVLPISCSVVGLEE